MAVNGSRLVINGLLVDAPRLGPFGHGRATAPRSIGILTRNERKPAGSGGVLRYIKEPLPNMGFVTHRRRLHESLRGADHWRRTQSRSIPSRSSLSSKVWPVCRQNVGMSRRRESLPATTSNTFPGRHAPERLGERDVGLRAPQPFKIDRFRGVHGLLTSFAGLISGSRARLKRSPAIRPHNARRAGSWAGVPYARL